MAKRTMHADVMEEQSVATSELAVAQTQAAQLLRDAAAQMTIGLQTLQQTLDRMAPSRGAPAITPVPQGQINAWEDDPFSEAKATEDPVDATPIQVAIPVNNNRLLQTQINGPSPVPRIYVPGTADFRYWTTTAALARGVNFWTQFLPTGTRWTTFQDPMRVTLVAGEDLNANYTRQFGLRFFQATVKGRDFFSGESPDIACHELGHAILDAIRPELFDAASTETAAFHESFGDMSAILSALQVDSLCEEVLRETGGRLNVNSRLSRLAEQLGRPFVNSLPLPWIPTAYETPPTDSSTAIPTTSHHLDPLVSCHLRPIRSRECLPAHSSTFLRGCWTSLAHPLSITCEPRALNWGNS